MAVCVLSTRVRLGHLQRYPPFADLNGHLLLGGDAVREAGVPGRKALFLEAELTKMHQLKTSTKAWTWHVDAVCLLDA